MSTKKGMVASVLALIFSVLGLLGSLAMSYILLILNAFASLGEKTLQTTLLEIAMYVMFALVFIMIVLMVLSIISIVFIKKNPYKYFVGRKSLIAFVVFLFISLALNIAIIICAPIIYTILVCAILSIVNIVCVSLLLVNAKKYKKTYMLNKQAGEKVEEEAQEIYAEV